MDLHRCAHVNAGLKMLFTIKTGRLFISEPSLDKISCCLE
jgi:hypothetical protein